MKRVLVPASLITIVLWASSCVPARKLQDEQALNQRRADSIRALLSTNAALMTGMDELRTNYDDLLKEVVMLRKDTTAFGLRYRQLQKLNHDLQDLNDEIIAKNKQLLENATGDRQKLQAELDAKLLELQRKESELARQQSDIDDLRSDLQQREKRLHELESMIARQDSVVNALRKKVSDALLGFSDSELKVTMKDGKVYVSLSEQLLFKSGSTDVDAKGQDALKKLAEVLKKNPDIEVEIEGHTDNVPMASTRIRNNWELSVLRATSIVDILTRAGVDPTQVTASGRGEYHPVATNATTDGKRLNRRTEIILSPKLDELFQLLEK
jgi:chemotaxis protein MotB